MIGVERAIGKVGQIIVLSTCHRASNCFRTVPCVKSVRYNSNRASICRINRLQYLRQYPTTVVNPDGSTYTIRYFEPRQIINLPVDVNALSEPERQKHMDRRRPKTKVVLEEDFDDAEFDSSKYLKLVKK